MRCFRFRVLRQNRRVIKEAGREQELEEFHAILHSISMGEPTDAVRRFLVEAGRSYNNPKCFLPPDVNMYAL